MVHDSQAYRKMDVTREHISRILELREILRSFQTSFSLFNAAVVCAILESISGFITINGKPLISWFSSLLWDKTLTLLFLNTVHLSAYRISKFSLNASAASRYLVF